MAFRDNGTLITSANTINIVANGTVEEYNGTANADAFVIADGNVGDDEIIGFGFNDTIITGKKIFDGNEDGYIAFGGNNTLDVDRFGSGSSRAGQDNISVTGTGETGVSVIRYLGTKDGGFAYASAEVRDNFLGHFTRGFDSTNGVTGGRFDSDVVRYDSSVASETYNFANSKNVLLIDNATGLNFGGDTINGFGNDDLLVTTSQLFNRNDIDGSDVVSFGGNAVLDLSGANGPNSSDPSTGPGGQVDLNAPNKLSVIYLGSETDATTGVTYYKYGSSMAALDLFAGTGN